MIKDKTKQKLLDEIQKVGNVFWSCQKVGINRSTYYRWKEEDKEFKQLADELEDIGRANMCDIAKMSLLQNVKEKQQRAIEYTLSHLAVEFKQKQTSKVVILHKKELAKPVLQETINDVIEDDEILAKIEKIKKFYEGLGGIPPKLDGSKIKDEELIKYEGYIEDWWVKNHRLLKCGNGEFLIFKRMDGVREETIEEIIARTEGSKLETDKQIEDAKENQTPSDRN